MATETNVMGRANRVPPLGTVLRLCWKDVQAYKGWILLSLSAYVLFASLTVVLERSLDVWCIVILFILVEGFMRNEDKHQGERLFASLPSKRSWYVLSRYVSSLFIILSIILLSLVAVMLLKQMLPVSYFEGHTVLTLRTVIIVVFLYYMFISVAFTLYFRFGYLGYPRSILVNLFAAALLWGMVSGVMFLAVALKTGDWGFSQYTAKKGMILSIAVGIFNRGIRLFGEPLVLLVLGVITAAVLTVSILWSLRVYKKRDL